MLHFANKLKTHRKFSNKTQDDMAQLLNVKRATYGEYERGNNLPPIDKLIIIAECFNVSIDYLVGRSEKEYVDVYETINHILNNLYFDKDYLRFNNNELSEVSCKLLACSLENVITTTNILMEEFENEK